jgi:hypothetical protein
LKQEGSGFLPVSGHLPDITAETTSYITIKKIYADRAIRDRNAISRHVRNILNSLSLPKDYVSDVMIDIFVRNCRTLHVSRMRTLSNDLELNCDDIVKSVICEALAEEIDALDQEYSPQSEENSELQKPPNDIHWFIAVKCADIFYGRHQRYPGDWYVTYFS